MSPEDFAELSPRIVGKNATSRESDAAWYSLGRYPAGMVVGLISRGISGVDALRVACERETHAQAARTAEPTCEHGHPDTPVDPCADCSSARRASAKAGADLCRASLAAGSARRSQ